MRHSKRNIYYHELIGLGVEVLEYPDPSIAGLSGRVVDETMKTLLIESPGRGFVRVLKEHGVFRFKTPYGLSFTVIGTRIVGRPEDRLKRIVRR
ncbi:MAG: ribonuclease P protein subunit [Thermoprotei archaeon]